MRASTASRAVTIRIGTAQPDSRMVRQTAKPSRTGSMTSRITAS